MKTQIALSLGLFLALPCTAGAEEQDHSHHHHHHQQQDDDMDQGDRPAEGSIYWLEGEWTSDANRKVALKSFEGKPVLLTLLFTSCKQACPILVEDLKRTQAGLTEKERKEIQFVIVSIDPERDTPEVLAEFKKKIPAAKEWVFLQGDADQVLELAGVLGVRYKKIGDDFIHSNKITVLDRKGEVKHQTIGLRAPAGETIEAVREELKSAH
jgi:protein SCO1/2